MAKGRERKRGKEMRLAENQTVLKLYVIGVSRSVSLTCKLSLRTHSQALSSQFPFKDFILFFFFPNTVSPEQMLFITSVINESWGKLIKMKYRKGKTRHKNCTGFKRKSSHVVLKEKGGRGTHWNLKGRGDDTLKSEGEGDTLKPEGEGEGEGGMTHWSLKARNFSVGMLSASGPNVCTNDSCLLLRNIIFSLKKVNQRT